MKAVKSKASDEIDMYAKKSLYKSVLIIFLGLLCNYSCIAQTYYPGGLPKSTFNLWFDASDVTTVTLSGGHVTQWKDKANQINASQVTVSKQPALSTLFGKKTIEFNGIQGLDMAHSTYVSPGNGFNLAQVVYIYSDASSTVTDNRNGTYSLNAPANSLNRSTPNIQLDYTTADSAYRFAGIGAGTHTFPDLRGRISLIENYMPTTQGTTTSLLNGGFSANGNVTAVTDIGSPATLGNREQYYANVHWGISETILTGTPLGTFGRNVIELYLAWKWNTTPYLSLDVLAMYNPGDTSFRNKLVAIGSRGSTDTITSTKNNNGLGFANTNAMNGFIRDKGDYVLAADNNATGTQSAGTGFTRWNRAWYFSKADAGGNGGGLKISFDFNTYSQAAPNTSTTDLYLLYNTGYGTFNSGNNTVIPITSAQLSGSVYTFTTDASNINNGYYTIVYAPHGTPVTQITNFNAFIAPVISLRPPVLQPTFAGAGYNTINWNIDSLGFTPANIKIYRGTSAGFLSPVDSVSGGTLFYNDYTLTNGTTYYYAVKALDGSGKASGFSNVLSATPGIYPASWNVLPQAAGTNVALMSAVVPSPNTNLRYYFEYTASGVTNSSGWVASSVYKDSTLTPGTTTSFRVKTADNSYLTTTVSDWSPTVNVSASADSVRGGYTFNWSKFNNSDNNVYGLGSTSVTLNPAGTPYIKLAPAAGIHPRLFCNPEDSTAIKWRLKNTASGKAIAAKIHAFTTLLTLGSTFNKTASYAVDSLNIAYTGTGNAFNHYNVKTTYDMLAAKTTPATSALNDYLSIALAYEAFECWLYKGTKDATTNTYYNDRAAKLAKAETYWASLVLADTTITLGQGISLIYDFGFNLMTRGQQDTVRLAISKKQAHVFGSPSGSDYYGFNSTSYATTSNWATWGYYVLTDLAMAGEPGANATRTITYARANWCFFTYGVYETGQPIEGLGKNEIDMRALVALARNGYSLLGHPNLRAFATKYMPAITQPFGYSFVGADLLGGFDNVNNYTNPIPSSPAYGGWIPKPGDMAGIKYVFPTDTAVDFVWKNYIKQYTSNQKAKDGYYQYQTFNTVVPAFWADIFGAIYPSDYFTTSFATEAQAALKTDTYFDYRGGFASLRSGFDQNAAALWFHNRSDLGGHPYDNKNDIMFSALGRAWLPKVSTNANTDSPWSSLPTAASGVLINGLGGSLGFAGSSVPVIVPGKIVYFSNNTGMSEIAGDATTAFSYMWNNTSGNPPVTETRNSFQYSQSTQPFFNVSFYNYPNTWTGGMFDNYVKAPYSNGVVKKVYRTVAMVKDTKPIVIIADDIQRNNSINNYKWLGQLATDLTIDSLVVDTTHGYYRNDVILKEPVTTGSRRLLVRVLNNTGAVNTAKPARIDSLFHIDPATTPIPANTTTSPRLVIESNSIDPKFKVMLYAYNAGEALPKTTWKGPKHDTLIVVNNSTTKTICFPVDTTGRTNIILVSTVVQYTFYSKATGDLSTLSTYSSNPDGTGSAPTDFNGSGTGATYQLANRTRYALTTDLTLGSTLNIPSGATLDLAGNALTLTNLSGTGTLTGSNTSSLTVNGTINSLAFAVGKEQLKTLTLGSSANLTLSSFLAIASTGTVTLGASSILNTNNTLTLRSDISGTGQIAALASGAAINGGVTIERYLADKRAWRLITPSVYSTQTINAAWQEGAGGGGLTNPNPGYGTFIIGSSTANGFDVAGSSGSLLALNNANTTFNSVPNTNYTTLNTNVAYFLFSIGNRSSNPATAGVHGATTLRAYGQVVTGIVPGTVNATGYTLFGNPYPAPIDFSQISRSASVPNQFYTWDINLGTYGGYVLFSYNGSSYTSVPSSPSGLSNIIPMGAAVFVNSDGTNTGSIIATESAKATGTGNNTFSNFSTPAISAGTTHDIRINLTDPASKLIDGVMVSFATGYSNKVDNNDAPKLTNFYENISLNRSGRLLTLERRSDITANDTVFIRLSGTKTTSYQLQIDAGNFNEPGMVAYLQDAYLHTSTKLDLTQVSNTSFSANADTASYNNRFMITLKPASSLLTFVNLTGSNPGRQIVLKWNVTGEDYVQQYTVEKWNGTSYVPISTVAATLAGNYSAADRAVLPGDNLYRISAKDSYGNIMFSNVVTMKISHNAAQVIAYPNPATKKQVNLSFDGLPAANYNITVTNSFGQIMQKSIMVYNGTAANKLLSFDYSPGVYTVIIQATGYSQSIKIIVP